MMFPPVFVKKCGRFLKVKLTNLLLWLLILTGKGVKDLAVVYATLIIKGKKTFAQVPDKLKEAVREILIALECPELVE